MKSPLVSIVLPVFNVEPYLAQCLDSIRCQTFVGWELVLVDDGSTDRSGEICDAYSQKDERIKVVHVTNGGVSHARNVGNELAKGEWITYVDGDDWLDDDYLDKLYEPISQSQEIEFVQGGCQQYKESKGCKMFQQYQYYQGSDPLYLLNHFRGLTFSKLFKKNILVENHVLFDEKVKIGEDYLFTLDYIKFVHDYCFIDSTSYYYRYREGSSSKSLANIGAVQKTNQAEHHVSSLVHFLSAHNIPYDATPIRWAHASSNLFNAIRSKGILKMDKDYRMKCRQLLGNYPLVKYQPVWKKKLYLWLFKWFNTICLLAG